jgi:hypothetical protein
LPTDKQDKTRIVQIWGDILDEGFTSVPNLLLRYRSSLGIKPKHLTLIIDIMSFKWDRYSPFPSYSTLAKRAGIEERSVKRITQDLEELHLLIKEPRFSEETGAQITTIFDFRPLVKKLTEEMLKSGLYKEENSEELSLEGGDKNVMGGGDKNVTGGVTKISRGGVTKMSPKEYSYINKTQINKSTYSVKEQKNEKKVHTDLKNSVFKTRLYEIYDNMNGVRSIEDIVEEGAYKTIKEIMVNRIVEISKKNPKIDVDLIASTVKTDFPYDDIPPEPQKARSFFVTTLCDMVADSIYLKAENN